jgi:hypothetical protein
MAAFMNLPSAPNTSGSDTTAIGLSDLENGKKLIPSITVTSINSRPERPVLGRRKTTSSITASPEHREGYDGEEDTLTKLGNFLWK